MQNTKQWNRFLINYLAFSVNGKERFYGAVLKVEKVRKSNAIKAIQDSLISTYGPTPYDQSTVHAPL